MRWLSLCLLLLLAPAATACPLCRDALTQTTAAEDIDRDREAASYNHSIYLMLAVPFLSAGVAGFCVYRGLLRKQTPPPPPDGVG
jgi:hypothetical protein